MPDGTEDIMGPFEQSQNRFWRGQVIPICSRWFGEINKDFEKIIQRLARESASDDGWVFLYLGTYKGSIASVQMIIASVQMIISLIDTYVSARH